MSEKKWTIAVDFDGVLHSYSSPWVNEHTIPDPPVPGAIDWLNEMLKSFEVVIHTTRGRTWRGRLAVRRWLWERGIRWPGAETWSDVTIQVTCKKPPALIYVDDRAWRFDGKNFPSTHDVHSARPWNKEADRG